jgi:hypothetical protein
MRLGYTLIVPTINLVSAHGWLMLREAAEKKFQAGFRAGSNYVGWKAVAVSAHKRFRAYSHAEQRASLAAHGIEPYHCANGSCPHCKHP